MTILIICSLIMLSGSYSEDSANAEIFGKILNKQTGEPVVGAHITVSDKSLVAVSDVKGQFRFKELVPGSYTLKVTAIGYREATRTVEVSGGQAVNLNIKIRESTLSMDEVVVTGTMRSTHVRKSPVKVQVIKPQFLERQSGNSMMESMNYINGLYQEVSCGVCGTNSVRINGMAGPYTAVLIDGMPIMGSLASVYGLNGIHTSLIKQIEIIKGPNSTLYGSEAMGGVINIRTKDPERAPLLTTEAQTSSQGEHSMSMTYAPRMDGVQTLLSVNGLYFDQFIDENNDQFSDVTQRKRFSAFNKWSFPATERNDHSIAAKIYVEERMGGTPGFTADLRGSDEVYGEYIMTERAELLGRYHLWPEEQVRVDYSYSYHSQKSYYGDYNYNARQQIGAGKVIWDYQLDANRQLLTGSSVRYEYLDQTFDQVRLPEGSEDQRFIPGLFTQYEQQFTTSFKGLLGMRVDHYDKHGLIYSPRMNVKWSPSNHTTLRFNAGTGFRIVNLFTEEHEALSGSRELVIEENLNPERSYNGTVNLNQIVDIGTSVLNVDVDLFYSHFTNQIVPDYDTVNEIRYRNLDGYAVSRGISVSAAHNFMSPFQYSIGVTWQDVYQRQDNEKQAMLFAPELNGVFSLSYTFTKINLALDYTGRVVGPMHLPEYPGYESKSEIFTEQNLKAKYQLSTGIGLYLTVQNLFNYTQQDPLVAPDRPFSDDFATDRVFGPMQPRRVVMGLTFSM